MIISTDTLVFPCGMSRSGTTLLATILDSHSRVSMCYELIPPEMPGPARLLKYLEQGLTLSHGDFSSCGRVLRKNGLPGAGLFFTRCHRAGIDEQDLEALLKRMLAQGPASISTLRQRLEVAWLIARQSAFKRNRSYYGFKLNIPSVEKAFDLFPNSKLIYILRDPRDVVASHIQRKFDRTISEICKAWNNYIQSFESFRKKYPDSGLGVRYEDIVRQPADALPEMLNFSGLPMEDSVLEFYKSKAGVHTYGHPNAENLGKDFFTSSIGRWKKELDSEQVKEIHAWCEQKMTCHGYEPVI